MAVEVKLISWEPEAERVCAAAMRSCYSPHAGYNLFIHAPEAPQRLEGERVFDDERVKGLLKRALELGHNDILEHNSFTWLVQSDEKTRIVDLLESSRFFEITQLDDHHWLVSSSFRVIVETATYKKDNMILDRMVTTLQEAAPTIWDFLSTATMKEAQIEA